MAVTLGQVAKEAQVSMATASRAFHSSNLLAGETRQKVIDAAKRLGYTMPASLRARTFAVVVPDSSSPIYGTLIKTFQQKAWPGRHKMVLADTDEDPGRELEVLRTLGEETDGIILCSPRARAADARAAVGDTPLVVLNGESAGSPVVIMDVEPGLRQCVEHLQALGHERIAYVPGPAASWANAARSACLVRVAAEHDMTLTVLGNQSATIHGGAAAAAAVIASGATAVIAYNDMVAIGVQSGLDELSNGVASEMGVVGIDDTQMVASVGLTTVRMDIDRSAALSLEFLMNLIEGRAHVPGPAVRFGSQLIVRASTARRPRPASQIT